MCTVTYIPLKNNAFILTSNRDENPKRKTISPKKYLENGVEIWYPKDELAGGTWIGTSDQKRVVCLLNGGFKKHDLNPPYKMSRGTIVKKLLAHKNAVSFINLYHFEGIEPFTIVLVDWNHQLETYELVWDGTVKHFKKLPQLPHIWSSSTLYTEETKKIRQKWFKDFLIDHEKTDQDSILNFHQNTTLGATINSLKMKRKHVETVSVTSIKKEKEVVMKYLDFVNNQSFYETIDL